MDEYDGSRSGPLLPDITALPRSTAVPITPSQPRKKQQRLKKCPHCTRAFAKNEHLQRHIRSHTHERPFQCRTCCKSFSRNDTLQRHERAHSEAETRQAETRQSGPGSSTATSDPQLEPPAFAASSNPAIPSEPHDGGPRSAYPVAPTAATQTDIAPDQRSPAHLSLDTDAVIVHHQREQTSFPTLGSGQCSGFSADWSQALDQDFANNDWLLASDFDIVGLDSTLKQTLADWADVSPFNVDSPPACHDNSPPPQQQVQPRLPSVQALNQQARSRLDAEGSFSYIHQGNHASRPVANNADTASGTEGATEPLWYTRLFADSTTGPSTQANSRMGSEEPSHDVNVDENYTATLSGHLQPRPYDATTLTVEYLNMCLGLYYTRFHPIFPVVHLPTFRPDNRNAFLFLSMCSVGSLYAGTSDAIEQGYRIHSRLNKAILASWETHLARKSHDSLPVIQAALIGQTFSLLSVSPANLVLADTFHGTVLSWARKMAREVRDELPPEGLNGDAKATAWRKWAHTEQIRRLMMALTIHDAELSVLFNHEPLLRQFSTLYSTPMSDALFDAVSADNWYFLFNTVRPSWRQALPIKTSDWTKSWKVNAGDTITFSMRHSPFLAYAVLQEIVAAIAEHQFTGELTDDKKRLCGDRLVVWQKSFQCHAEKNEDAFHLQALWHCAFMALCTDFNAIEQFVRRSGPGQSPAAVQKVASWAHSQDMIRGLVHASMLQKHVELMRLNATPPVHIPRALYSAGLVWAGHLRVQQTNYSAQPKSREEIQSALADFPECRELSTMSKLQIDEVVEACGRRPLLHNTPLFGIMELLRRLSRWGISEIFCSILQAALT